MPLTDRVKSAKRNLPRGLIDIHSPDSLTIYDCKANGTAVSVKDEVNTIELYAFSIGDGVRVNLTSFQVAQLAKALTTWLVEDNRRQRDQLKETLE